MRLLFVDRVLELRYRRRVVAITELSPEEEVFSHHFPANPILPASLLMECFAQAATVLIEASSGFTRKGLPGFIQGAKFHRPIKPEGPLLIEMDVEQWSDEGALLRGRASQAGVRCATCTLGMVSAPLAGFYGPEHSATYRDMYARWFAGTELAGFKTHPLESLRHALGG
jgi:3-hydroxyacyl-[acyl-carrier-protein] dehydratase